MTFGSFYPQNAAWEVEQSTALPSLQSLPTRTSTTKTTTTTTRSNKKLDEEAMANTDDTKDNLQDKLKELLDHNTKLVDIVKATLQVQFTLFSRIISIILPESLRRSLG